MYAKNLNFIYYEKDGVIFFFCSTNCKKNDKQKDKIMKN